MPCSQIEICSIINMSIPPEFIYKIMQSTVFLEEGKTDKHIRVLAFIIKNK